HARRGVAHQPFTVPLPTRSRRRAPRRARDSVTDARRRRPVADDPKTEYQQEAQSALDKLKAQLDELRVQADLAQAEARDRLSQGIDALRKRQGEAKAKVDEAQTAGAGAWQSVAKQAESVVGDLGDAFSKLATEVQAAAGAAGSAATKGRDAFLDEWKRMRAKRNELLDKAWGLRHRSTSGATAPSGTPTPT